MAARSQKGSEKAAQRLDRQLLPISRDPRRAAKVRQAEAEAARAEHEVAKLAGELSRQPLERRLLEVRIEEGRAEVDHRRGEIEANDFAILRAKALLVVFLLLVILMLALALIDPTMLETLGTNGFLAGIVGFAGGRFGKN
jgi:hypothetical protein